MLPVTLKLVDIGNCFIHLPKGYCSRLQVKDDPIISVKSIQNELELLVLWDGTITSGDFAELDINFAQANNIQSEVVVLNEVLEKNASNCSSCLVELVQATDVDMVREHNDINLLATCRLISKGLVIPIKLHQHVQVLAKVNLIEPATQLGILTSETRMEFLQNEDQTFKHESGEYLQHEPSVFDDFISYYLGLKQERSIGIGSILIQGDHGSGKTHHLKNILNVYKKYHSQLISCKSLRGKRMENIRKIINDLSDNAVSEQRSIIAFDDIDALLYKETKHEDEKGSDALYRARCVDTFCSLFKKLDRSTVAKGCHFVVLSTCVSLSSLERRIAEPTGRLFFNKIIKLSWPDLDSRQQLMVAMTKQHNTVNMNLSGPELETIAKHCNMFMPLDMRHLVERGIINACSRSLNAFDSNPLSLESCDLTKALNNYTPISLRDVRLQQKTSKSFEDIGGMGKVKHELKRTVLLQVKHPHVFLKSSIKPQRSVLLHGPPGCGKTLIAEALMNEDCINSICVRGPELLSKYMGSSEAAVRDIFKRAELAKPCLIFFDEFESLVPKRGSDSTGVTDRVVNQFLTLMDGVEGMSRGVFILAATSRPDMIDPAILRPGRLDKHIFCGLPNLEERKDILKKLSRLVDLTLDEDSLRDWAEELEYFSGADIQSLLYSAQLKSLHETIGQNLTFGKVPDVGHKKLSDELELQIKEFHLRVALNEMKPDVVRRYASQLCSYPDSIGQMNRGVAQRATLA